MTAIRFEPSCQARGRLKTRRHHRRPRSGRPARMPAAARRPGLSADGRGRDNRAARSLAAGDRLKPDWRRSAEGTDTGHRTSIALATMFSAGSREPLAKELAAFLAQPPGPSFLRPTMQKARRTSGGPSLRTFPTLPMVGSTDSIGGFNLTAYTGPLCFFAGGRPRPPGRQSLNPYTPRQWVHEDAEGRGGLWTARGGACARLRPSPGGSPPVRRRTSITSATY